MEDRVIQRAEKWRATASEFSTVWKDEVRAHTILVVIADFEAMAREVADETVDYDGAVKISGYSRKTLERWKRTGKLINYGTEHRPRFRVADLPIKAGHATPTIAGRAITTARRQREAEAEITPRPVYVITEQAA